MGGMNLQVCISPLFFFLLKKGVTQTAMALQIWDFSFCLLFVYFNESH